MGNDDDRLNKKRRKINQIQEKQELCNGEDDDRKESFDALLDWTSKQGRILTAEGKYIQFYKPNTFQEDELPHYHLMNHSLDEAFELFQKGMNRFGPQSDKCRNVVCGAFKRTLFNGLFEHSTDRDERVFNVQTNTLFVDIRIPVLRDAALLTMKTDEEDKTENTTYEDYSNEELRILSRQHAFAGFTVQAKEGIRFNCTRHHCIDWNFIPKVSSARPRPNKWWVELNDDKSIWTEWAFATDSNNQHYYMERWERLPKDEFRMQNQFVLALRRPKGSTRDGIIVIVGQHLIMVIYYVYGVLIIIVYVQLSSQIVDRML